MDIWGLADCLKVQGISFDAIARLDLKNTVISLNCRKEFSLDRLKVINLLAVFLASFCGGVSNPKLRDSKHLAFLTLDTTAAGSSAAGSSRHYCEVVLAAAQSLWGLQGQLGQAHRRKIHIGVLNLKSSGGLGQKLWMHHVFQPTATSPQAVLAPCFSLA